MVLLKQGQGAAKAASELMRTPERQALADAIARRTAVADLVERQRAVVKGHEDRRDPIYDQRAELEARLKEAPSTETHRLDALLRGQDPEAGIDRESIKKQLEDLEAQLTGFWELQRRAEADTDLLLKEHEMCEMHVRDCVRKVVRSEPAQAAVTAELLAINARRAFLGRAADQALNEYEPGASDRGNSSLGHKLVPAPRTPCPWALARERLLIDPDAVLPMPAEV